MTEALESVDTIKVDTLVQEFFAQQSLKILPQAPFGDAVNQFVSKDDKHAVEMFVIDSLSSQVKGLLQLDDDRITEGLDAHIDDFRKVMEKSFMTGQRKQAQRKKRFKEKPDGWDSDLDGHWTAQPGAIEEVPVSPEPVNGRGRTRPNPGATFSDGDEEVPDDDEPSATKVPAKRVAAKATRSTKKTVPAKKAAPAKKATAPRKAPALGRKKANPFQDSEEEEEEEEDVIMEDDVESKPPTRAPARSTRNRGAAAKPRQTTINFSQSQKPKTSQKPVEISDDEISEDDAFESMPATRSRRR